jgi:Hydroxyacylglutathione hydrolase C-terminus
LPTVPSLTGDEKRTNPLLRCDNVPKYAAMSALCIPIPMRPSLPARSRGLPTVPSLMGDEKRTNPFLRCDNSSEIRSNVGDLHTDSDATVFEEL